MLDSVWAQTQGGNYYMWGTIITNIEPRSLQRSAAL
jgi:hypothetical protein